MRENQAPHYPSTDIWERGSPLPLGRGSAGPHPGLPGWEEQCYCFLCGPYWHHPSGWEECNSTPRVVSTCTRVEVAGFGTTQQKSKSWLATAQLSADTTQWRRGLGCLLGAWQGWKLQPPSQPLLAGWGHGFFCDIWLEDSNCWKAFCPFSGP